jgi:hypothetical protein
MMPGPVTTPIPHVDGMDPVAFTHRYAEPAVPVVLRGAAESWPALEKWSHRWFGETFGERRVHVSFGGPLDGRREAMALDNYLRDIAQSSGSPQPYLRLEPLPGVLPELKEDFTVPSYCPPARNVAVHLWVGPEGTVQPFHRDNRNPLAAVNNLLVQVRGRKVVSLVSADQTDKMYPYPAGSTHANYSQVNYLRPDPERFPEFHEVEIAETVIEPGEMVFIPADTWHHVRSLDPSISLSFWWYRTAIADVVASLASLEQEAVRRPGPLGPGPRIDVLDVEEFGGIWTLALATRSLPVDRRPLLMGACTEPVAAELRTALHHLGIPV